MQLQPTAAGKARDTNVFQTETKGVGDFYTNRCRIRSADYREVFERMRPWVKRGRLVIKGRACAVPREKCVLEAGALDDAVAAQVHRAFQWESAF
ncbi:hypothetical protein D9M73_280590 [compost metagenome]